MKPNSLLPTEERLELMSSPSMDIRIIAEIDNVPYPESLNSRTESIIVSGWFRAGIKDSTKPHGHVLAFLPDVRLPFEDEHGTVVYWEKVRRWDFYPS